MATMQRTGTGTDAAAINQRFYDALWADTYLIRPERFNTWPLVAELNAAGSRCMEIGPGLRPRLPIRGTCFIEISLAALSRLAEHGGFAAQASAEALPFPDAAFDLVMAMDIIEHVENDESVLRELARVIRPGGTLVLSSPLHPDSWTSFDDVVGHLRRYRPQELLERLVRHGLTLERSAIYGMQPRSRTLSRMGAWWLTQRREEAMRWYNRVFMPIRLFFEKRLRLRPGMIDAAHVDEVLLVCRRRVPD
ncbi:MAG TPA: methyltransferase domain-containing protein [Candidatus Polarisedimenticolia bacterium]|nr:methyltransferase domain-containing protein [Candidatus Polarisedimenticolia bacterium]